MNISAEMLIVAGSSITSIIGFAITAGLLFKGNKHGFDAIEASSKSGFEKVELKISSLVQILALEREGMQKDIHDAKETITDVRSQLRAEIFPRLNNVETLIGKNCQALLDHKGECKKTHAVK